MALDVVSMCAASSGGGSSSFLIALVSIFAVYIASDSVIAAIVIRNKLACQ